MIMSSKCIVCGSDGNYIADQYDDERKNKFDIHKCENCKLEYLYPMYTQKDLDTYFSRYQDFRENIEAIKLTAKRNIEFLNKFGLRQDSNLLDFGCGQNVFIKTADNETWLGYDKYVRTDSKIIDDYKNKEWEFVTMWGVLGHLPNPLSELKNLSRQIKNGGKIIITEVASNLFIPFQYRYEHVTYWSKKSAEILLKKSGFKLILFDQYKMIQDSTIYLDCVLRTVPSDLKKMISSSMPKFVEIPTNQAIFIGEKE
jgi:hypothetical protein